MASALELIDFKNPVFMAYAFWGTALALKMLFMSIYTAIFRFKNQVGFHLHLHRNIGVHFSLNETVITTSIWFLYPSGIFQSRRWWRTLCSFQCWRSRTCSTVTNITLSFKTKTKTKTECEPSQKPNTFISEHIVMIWRIFCPAFSSDSYMC